MAENPGRVITEYDFMSVFSKAWYRTMTMPTIMSGFRITGVYPFNRNAIQVVDTTPAMKNSKSLAEKNGLAFIPLYSPARSKKSMPVELEHSSHEASPSFSEQEIAKFIRRYEEGFNITSDARYNKWLQQYKACQNPDVSTESSVPDLHQPSNLLLGGNRSTRSALENILQCYQPGFHSRHDYVKNSAKVLTSSENKKLIEEKEQLKLAKEAEKKERQLQREKKRAEKQEEKRRKELLKASKGIILYYST